MRYDRSRSTGNPVQPRTRVLQSSCPKNLRPFMHTIFIFFPDWAWGVRKSLSGVWAWERALRRDCHAGGVRLGRSASTVGNLGYTMYPWFAHKNAYIFIHIFMLAGIYKLRHKHTCAVRRYGHQYSAGTRIWHLKGEVQSRITIISKESIKISLQIGAEIMKIG